VCGELLIQAGIGVLKMKAAASSEAYDQYQNVVLTGLDVAVSTYMDSRRA
jgi:hypothetical protein